MQAQRENELAILEQRMAGVANQVKGARDNATISSKQDQAAPQGYEATPLRSASFRRRKPRGVSKRTVLRASFEVRFHRIQGFMHTDTSEGL